MAANALRQELPGHPDPVSISGYYLSTSRPGPLSVQTEVIRRGRGLSNATASLSQLDEDGHPAERLRVVAGYTDLAALDGEVRTSAVPPQLPPPEQCVGREHMPMPITPDLALLERFELRLDPATVGWAVGQPSMNGRLQGWFRLADGREPDPLSLLLVADALPPVTYDLGFPGWAPTVELTVHLRAVPPRAGCGSATAPATWPAATSRRTARSGTRRAGWSPSPASWPGCPGRRNAPRAHRCARCAPRAPGARGTTTARPLRTAP